MENIDNLIRLFLEPYVADDNIQAAVLTGSYAQGNENKNRKSLFHKSTS